MKPCKKCNDQGYYLTQPLSARALEALAVAFPDEPITVVESLCNCGKPDARIAHETGMAWTRLLKGKSTPSDTRGS